MVTFFNYSIICNIKNINHTLKIINRIYNCYEYESINQIDNKNEFEIVFRCNPQNSLIKVLPLLYVENKSLEIKNEIMLEIKERINDIIISHYNDLARIYTNVIKYNDINCIIKDLTLNKIIVKGCQMSNGNWIVVPKKECLLIEICN